MADPRFYDSRGPFALGALAQKLGARLSDGADPAAELRDLAAIGEAGAGELCFCEDAKFLAQLEGRRPGAVIAKPALADAAPPGLPLLIHDAPARAFAEAGRLFYPGAGKAGGATNGVAVDPSARLGEGVVLEAGVVIGPGVEIGAGTHVAANAVIGRGVCIGRDAYIGPNASVIYALLGDRVIVQGGARIGTDGFGFASSAAGHLKAPQLGRVILQDDVEIGANSCIDRGALSDTVIGEGSKIDNLVQVGHNCRIGRRVIMTGQVGLSGTVTIGDWSVLAGQSGVVDHVTIGPGTRVGAKSAVFKDLAGPGDYGGIPAQPIAGWRREVAAIRRLAKGTRRRNE